MRSHTAGISISTAKQPTTIYTAREAKRGKKSGGRTNATFLYLRSQELLCGRHAREVHEQIVFVEREGAELMGINKKICLIGFAFICSVSFIISLC